MVITSRDVTLLGEMFYFLLFIELNVHQTAFKIEGWE
jgi:hypothetical protein